MLEILKKIFFALLPFLQKAAEDALNDATASKGGSESSQKSESRKDDSRQGEARTSGSSAPKPSAPKPSASTRSASTASASAGSDYPGDYRDMIDFEYSPSMDATLTRVKSCGRGFPSRRTTRRVRTARCFWWVVTVSTCWH